MRARDAHTHVGSVQLRAERTTNELEMPNELVVIEQSPRPTPSDLVDLC